MLRADTCHGWDLRPVTGRRDPRLVCVGLELVVDCLEEVLSPVPLDHHGGDDGWGGGAADLDILHTRHVSDGWQCLEAATCFFKIIINSQRRPQQRLQNIIKHHLQTGLLDTVHHGSMAAHLALVAVVLTAQGRGAVAAQTQRAAPVAVVQTAVVALTTGTSLLSLFCHPQPLQKCYLQWEHRARVWGARSAVSRPRSARRPGSSEDRWSL